MTNVRRDNTRSPEAIDDMSDAMTKLSGLDGANPLAFLAALGVLRVLTHRARTDGREAPRLSWIDEGCWLPVIHGAYDIDAILCEILEDRATWEDDPAFLLAYDDTGETLVDPRKAKGKLTRDLKPKPSAMRAFLEGLASRVMLERRPLKPAGVPEPAGVERLLLRRALDTAAAYGSDVVQDNNGNTKPTAFHFAAGQQQFMKAVSELQAGVDSADLCEALLGPWRRESTLPNLGWDATNARYYALRANNPSGEKKTTIAGADWLAFIGLGALPSFPRADRLVTTGVRGGWKDSTFTWVLWSRPATMRVAASLERTPDPGRLTAAERRARSIAAVFCADINRSDQGGYGSFAPAAVQ